MKRHLRSGARGMALLVLAISGIAAAAGGAPAKEEPTRQKVTTFLMFEGKAEQAMSFYVSLFPGAKVVSITRYRPGEPGPEGTIRHATFSIAGQQFMCIDSYVKHGFTFTPAMSLFVTCDSEAEIAELFAKLSQDGQVMMPLDAYPFARKFAWVADRFGVSWQLSLPRE